MAYLEFTSSDDWFGDLATRGRVSGECEDKWLKVEISVGGREETRTEGKVALMTDVKSPIQFKHSASIVHLFTGVKQRYNHLLRLQNARLEFRRMIFLTPKSNVINPSLSIIL